MRHNPASGASSTATSWNRSDSSDLRRARMRSAVSQHTPAPTRVEDQASAAACSRTAGVIRSTTGVTTAMASWTISINGIQKTGDVTRSA